MMIVVVTGFLIPQEFSNPVRGSDRNSYHPKSFWYFPWGNSGTHKGVDIFAKEGTQVNSATSGIVMFAGDLKKGGNVVVVLGPKWRVHYYAHLKEIDVRFLDLSSAGERVGTVGTTGNAKGKPAHLHYSVFTLIPYPWRIDKSPQGWKKMFFLNPIDFLEAL
jgi:murein DD-endopeptidase MepM/ murein hydrolase activator NlpD